MSATWRAKVACLNSGESGVQFSGEKRITGTIRFLVARGALHAFQLLEKREGIQVECAAAGGCILLSVSCLCCCSFDVQQYVMLIYA